MEMSVLRIEDNGLLQRVSWQQSEMDPIAIEQWRWSLITCTCSRIAVIRQISTRSSTMKTYTVLLWLRPQPQPHELSQCCIARDWWIMTQQELNGYSESLETSSENAGLAHCHTVWVPSWYVGWGKRTPSKSCDSMFPFFMPVGRGIGASTKPRKTRVG